MSDDTGVVSAPTAKSGMAKSSQKAPWTVAVDVYLKDVYLDEAGRRRGRFTLETPMAKNKDDDLVFENRGRPGFNVVFNLHDETGGGYGFPKQADKEEAVWSRYGPDCPDSEVRQVFRPLRIEDEGMTLVVRNENPAPAGGPFKYSLRVTNDGTNYVLLDPGGVNENGGFRA